MEKVKKEGKELTALGVFFTALEYTVLFFVFVIMCWLIAFNVRYKCYIIEGASMQPYLNPSLARNSQDGTEDGAYIDIYGHIDVYDAVVIAGYGEEGEIAKRVLATEGQYITIKKDGGYFYIYRIDDEQTFTTLADYKIVESIETTGYEVDYERWNDLSNTNGYESKFYNKFLSTDNEVKEFDGVKFVKVPEGKYLCLGDNREWSADSRYYGFFDKKDIVGDVEFLIKDYNFGNRLLGIIRFFWEDVERLFAR